MNLKKYMKIYEDESEIVARIACSCTSSEHDCEIFFEHDYLEPASYRMSITMQYTAQHHSRWGNNVVVRAWDQITWRVKTAAKILFAGRVETNAEMYLDEDNIKAFSSVVNDVKKRIDKKSKTS